MGALSFTSTVLKGAAGHMCETKSPNAFFVAGLLFQAAGCALLIVATSSLIEFAAAFVFGTCWPLRWLGLGWADALFRRHDRRRDPGAARSFRSCCWLRLLAPRALSAPALSPPLGYLHTDLGLYTVVLSLLAVPVLLIRGTNPPRPKWQIAACAGRSLRTRYPHAAAVGWSNAAFQPRIRKA